MKLGALLTHPIQYYSPWLRDLAAAADLKVYYAHNQSAEGQAKAGFGQAFEWDVPLLEGYDWTWLNNVARRPGLDSFGGCDTPEIGAIIRREAFDAFLMFGWNRKCFVQAAWAARRAGVPVLVRVDSQLPTPRAAWKRALKFPVYRLILPRFGHYMSPGARTDAYLRHYGVPAARIHRVPHMIDTERFAAGADEARRSGAVEALRKAHDAAPNDTVLLFAGKFIDKKRPMLLLQALQQYLSSHPGGPVRLLMVGDGPLRPALEAFAAAHDLPVRFFGFANQSQLPALYAAADCLVLPSNAEETWGLVVNEAFACGLPAIVSAEAGCAPDMIQDGVTGWTLQTPDVQSLASVIATAAASARFLPRGPIDALTRRSSYQAGVSSVIGVVSQLRGPRASG